ncbi:MAG: S8 family serine peptidase [Rhizobiaceae bacterium]|nr:S8 family serine peptidase [Rhizobiaceae bacterium]
MVGILRIGMVALAGALAGCTLEDIVPSDSTADLTPSVAPGQQVFPGYATVDTVVAERLRQNAEFGRIDLGQADEAAMRASFGLGPPCAQVSSGCTSASTLVVQNVHVAHASVLADGSAVRGGGQLIAIVDEGFRTAHEDFSGKSIVEFSSSQASAERNHGTAVAGVAAARLNGVGIVGVAPDASLHLTSWGNQSLGDMLGLLAASTRDAAARGAVAQNNSWGWTGERSAFSERAFFNASGLKDYALFAPASYGGKASDWGVLFDAYDAFQSRGVIVYANSNDDTLPDVSAWAALPLLVPKLREAWVVVGNALLEVNSQGRIVDADMLSAPCGSAAAFCLVTDGSVMAPNAATDSSYAIVTGTSFAAPQVAGHIALLSQAFPNLSPAERLTRLLATAQNGWSSFAATRSGEVTFAPGVTRPQSRLYGMGVPDIAAALAPIGGLAIATGATVATAAAMPVGGGVDATAPVVGSAIAQALAGREIMLIDALGTDFRRTGSEIGLKGSSVQPPVANPSQQIAAQAQSFAFGFAAQAGTAATVDAGMARLFFSQSLAGAAGSRFSNVIRLDRVNLLHVAGYFDDRAGAPAAAVSLSRLREHARFTTEFSLSAGHHQNRLFDAVSSGPFLGVDSTTATTASVGATARFGEHWSLSGFAEIGVGAVAGRTGGLAQIGPILHASAGVAAARHDALLAGDRLSLYLGLRPRVVAGRARLRVPAARDQSGAIAYEAFDVDLSSGGGVPLRAGFGYLATLPGAVDLSLNANIDFDATVEEEPLASASVALRKRF